MQMVKMRMRHQHQVNRRKITQPYARFFQPFQDKQPAGKIWIDDYVASAHLDEEAGMADERNSQFLVPDQLGLVSFSRAWRYRRVLYQPPEGAGTLTKDGIV